VFSVIDLSVVTKGGNRFEKCHAVVLYLKVVTTICGYEAQRVFSRATRTSKNFVNIEV
jgi:hypothetical protein